MAKRIRAARITSALNNIGNWRREVQGQAAAHLLPMLALVGRGAANPPGKKVLMNETPHEFDFWNKYFRIEDGDTEKPYFNPVTLRRAESGFPHSNSATIRKNTFSGKWGAATREGGPDGEIWSLASNYADIFRDKVLTKGAITTRVPVVDLAIIMFREYEFQDEVDASLLEAAFRAEFNMLDSDYEKIFEFRDESAAHIFTDEEVDDYEDAILSALIDDLTQASALPEATPIQSLSEDDLILTQVQQLMALGTSGVIFTGIPGTGKSFYAREVAHHLVRDSTADVFRVQFHPSYGYEDFVEGYQPSESSTSGFRIVPKTFLQACMRAAEVRDEDRLVVIIIDEINRGDPARVFGELLTYIERTYRDTSFILPFSGERYQIPSNLFIIGTMNPHDRSVAQMDSALIRRFDHIEIPPSREVAEELLSQSDYFSSDGVSAIGDWFEKLQDLAPGGLGHSYFVDVRNLEHLTLIWRYRMKPMIQSSLEFGNVSMRDIEASFNALVQRLEDLGDNA